MFEDKVALAREKLYKRSCGKHLCATCFYADPLGNTTKEPHSCEFYSRIVEKHGDWTELGVKNYDINKVFDGVREGGLSRDLTRYVVDKDYKDEGIAEAEIIVIENRGPEFVVRRCQGYREAPGVKYDIYLHSDEWRSRRMVAIEKAGYRCQICGSALNLEVHHITYDRLGHEADDDLIAVCKKCHNALHSGMYRLEKRTNGRRY